MTMWLCDPADHFFLSQLIRSMKTTRPSLPVLPQNNTWSVRKRTSAVLLRQHEVIFMSLLYLWNEMEALPNSQMSIDFTYQNFTHKMIHCMLKGSKGLLYSLIKMYIFSYSSHVKAQTLHLPFKVFYTFRIHLSSRSNLIIISHYSSWTLPFFTRYTKKQSSKKPK